MSVLGDSAIINNSGTISTKGLLASGISTNGNNPFINNSGSISTTGEAATGIFSTFGDNQSISNSGSIVTSGDYSDGIRAFGENISIINSGLISATGDNAFAIVAVGDGTVISLLPGSVIEGEISLGDGQDTLNLSGGQNWLLTINDDNGNGVAETINTYGNPSALLNGGLTIATFDAGSSLFGLEDDMLDDINGSIRSSIQRRLGAFPGGLDATGTQDQQFWFSAFGLQRDRDEQEHTLGGGMLGYDRMLNDT